MQNFLAHYRQLGDSWIVFDNSGTIPTVVALKKQDRPLIIDRELYEALIHRYGKP